MSNNQRILNVSRGFTLKHKQAVRAIANCACAWVEYGISIRDLTIAEAIMARNDQARSAEPLPLAELPGLRMIDLPGYSEEIELSRQANKFAFEAISA
jgi:hypothetical protein